MPFTRLFYHLIWATKNRLPLITPSIEESLYSFLAYKAGELGCRLLAINGLEDHVHLVIEIAPKVAVATVIRRLKGASTHEFSDLYWQRGYGALTIGERNLAVALEYVRRQKEHHSLQTAIVSLERCDEGADVETKEEP